MRAAVVGHVEWVSFARVERLPAPGDIVHALDHFEEAAGGGAVAAVQLARLGGACTFLTALGDDALGRRALERLTSLGVDVRVAWREAPTRRAIVHVDAAGERTITVVGERIVPHRADRLPWAGLAGMDGVYFTGGDAGAAAAARAAPLMVATPRAHEALSDTPLDVLVWSAGDADEERWAAGLRAGARVRTAGSGGGTWTTAAPGRGAWQAAEPPGATVDAYGCGDSFAAGLTFALGRGRTLDDAVREGARCGAVCLTGRGPYGAQV